MVFSLDYKRLKNYVIEELASYWCVKDGVLALPIPALPWPQEEPLPPQMKFIDLPAWAEDIGVKGALLVPAHFIRSDKDGDDWTKTDWFSVMFWYLNGIPERAFEAKHGPIHSYSYRLKGWDHRLWEHAWVNRMAIFLRKWVARDAKRTEDEVCGPLPQTNILITHDLDAINKTLAIRMKQSAFHFINAARLLERGQYKASIAKFLHALNFFFIREISIAWIKCAAWNRHMDCAA